MMTWKKNRLMVLLVLFSVILGLSSHVYAGWIEVERDGSTTLISKGKIKNTQEDGWSTMDTSTGEMTLGNSRQSVYSTGSVDDFCEAIETLRKEMMEQMPSPEEMMGTMMEEMTPEQRKMLEQMMGQVQMEDIPKDQMMGEVPKESKPPKVSVKKAGKGGVIAGFDTVKYNVLLDDRVYREVWVIKDMSSLKEVEKEWKKAMHIGEKFEKCMARTGEMVGVTDMPESSPEYIELQQKGFVLKEIREGEVESEVIKLEKRSIPESEFKPPAGYRKVAIRDFFMIESGEDEDY